MKNERPGIVTAAAILNIVMGALGLLCGVCGLIGNAALLAMSSTAGPNNPAMNPVNDMMQFVEKRVPAYRAVEIGKPSVVLVLSVLLVIAGIGLLSMKGWARVLTFLCAAVALPLHLGYAAYEYGYVMPAVQAWQQDFLAKQGGVAAPPQQNMAATGVGVVFGASLPVLHAIIVVVLLVMPGVGAAFAGAGRGRYDDEDDDDLDAPADRGRRRRRRGDEDDEDDDEDDDRGRVRRRDRDY